MLQAMFIDFTEEHKAKNWQRGMVGQKWALEIIKSERSDSEWK